MLYKISKHLECHQTYSELHLECHQTYSTLLSGFENVFKHSCLIYYLYYELQPAILLYYLLFLIKP